MGTFSNMKSRGLTVLVVYICLVGVKSTSEMVCVEPKMVTGTYGQPACFNCTTSHLEAHWQVDNDEPINGNPDHKNGQTFSTYCLDITKSMTITCHGFTNVNETGTDTGEIIMIDGVEDTDVLPTHLPSNAPLTVDLIGGNGSLVGSGNVSLTLWFNISADSKGNPQYICTKIKHPVGGNTTICSSQYQHNHSLVVTVHWMFDPSVVNPCGLNLTVQLTAVRKNMSSPFSIPITVPIDCPVGVPTNRSFDNSLNGVTIIAPVVNVVAMATVLAIALVL